MNKIGMNAHLYKFIVIVTLTQNSILCTKGIKCAQPTILTSAIYLYNFLT